MTGAVLVLLLLIGAAAGGAWRLGFVGPVAAGLIAGAAALVLVAGAVVAVRRSRRRARPAFWAR